MAASGASVEVLSTLALRGVLTEAADDFRARHRLAIAATYTSTNAALSLIGDGTRADVAILTHDAMERLVGEGVIIADSTADIARSGIGIAVPADAPKPDISTVAAFKRALLEAKAVAFSRSGASGMYFAEVIERLGIAEEVRRKAKVIDTYVGEFAARHEVELAVQQISELMSVSGIDIVGPLPAELQKITVFAAGVFAEARDAAGAAELIAYLAAPALAPVLIRKGLEPVTSAQ